METYKHWLDESHKPLFTSLIRINSWAHCGVIGTGTLWMESKYPPRPFFGIDKDYQK